MNLPNLPSVFVLQELLTMVIGIIIVWLIASLPVYIAGKLVARENTTYGGAMLATLLGPIIYFAVLFTLSLLLQPLMGLSAIVLAFIVAFIAWIGVYKSSFKTGWLQAFGITILASIIFLVLSILLTIFFGVTLPTPSMHYPSV